MRTTASRTPRKLARSLGTATVQPLERRRLLATGAATVDNLFAPGDVVVSNAAAVGGIAYFFARDMSTSTARLWRTDGTPAGTSQTDLTFEVAGGAADPRPVMALNAQLLFVATDAADGRELFVSDGTAAGTHAISNFAGAASDPQSFVDAGGGQIFFTVAADSATGQELWRTDGTFVGTRLVKDVHDGPTGSSPSLLTAMGGRVYFAGDDGIAGRELWTSDGTEAGTSLVVDLLPGPTGSAPTALHADGGRLFLAASGGAGVGSELWVSDGTAGGTQLLKDINSGDASSSPAGFVSFNGAVYFNAFEPTKGRELWRTDGTAPGTAFAAEVVVGTNTNNGAFGETIAAGGKIYVVGPGFLGLHASDGTQQGTVRLHSAPNQSGVRSLRVLNGGSQVAFVGNLFPLAGGANIGEEIWITNGTVAGTGLLRDFAAGSRTSKPTQLSVLPNQHLFFGATDIEHGAGPWMSDGSTGGTMRVAQVFATPRPPAALNRLVAAGDWVYAVGSYTSPYLASQISALWSTNGRPGGGRLLTTVADVFGTDVLQPTASGRLYFGGADGLWVTDGTRGGTIKLPVAPLLDSFVSGRQRHTAAVGETLYFIQRPPLTNRTELWRTDGTVFGTKHVRSFTGQTAVGHAAYLAPIGDDKVFFYAYETGVGFEPWVSDGTAVGTVLLRDVNPGGNSSELTTTADATVPFPVGDDVYFFGNDGTHLNGLWITDGTRAGTRFVKDLVPGSTFDLAFDRVRWASIGSTAYFTGHASPPGSGVSLWRTDGTEAGTFVLDGGYSHWPQGLATYDGKVFFARGGGDIRPGSFAPNTLYVGDGTPGGFQPLRTFEPHSNSSPAELVTGPDGVYFVANTAETGRELWYSDGTSGNTQLVFDSIPGPNHPYFGIAPNRDGVYFNALSRLHRTPPLPATVPDEPGVHSGIGSAYALGGSGLDRTLHVTAGTVVLEEDAPQLYPGLEVVVAAGAHVVFTASHRLDRLEVNGSLRVSGDGVVLVTGALDVALGATLDLGTNDLAVDYAVGESSPLGTWTGGGGGYNGVTGLLARGQMFGADTEGLTRLGVAEAADVLGIASSDTALWNGQAVDATAVLVKYTYAGDANLDGVISGDDYSVIDFNVAVPGAFGYYNGDFNFDGIISGDDYSLIDFNIAAQGAPL